MIFRSSKRPDYLNKDFNKSLRKILGFLPGNLENYHRAFLHSSYANNKDHLYKKHNERLEFLGDLILDAAVGEYLFLKFPHLDEGDLTRVKTRFVNRKMLNELAERLGIEKLIVGHFKDNKVPDDSKGNALEALIGAIFLDKGYAKTSKIVMNQFFDKHINLLALITKEEDFKSILVKWCQKSKLKFDIAETIEDGSLENRIKIELLINEELMGTGTGKTKKEAELNAYQNACEHLRLI